MSNSSLGRRLGAKSGRASWGARDDGVHAGSHPLQEKLTGGLNRAVATMVCLVAMLGFCGSVLAQPCRDFERPGGGSRGVHDGLAIPAKTLSGSSHPTAQPCGEWAWEQRFDYPSPRFEHAAAFAGWSGPMIVFGGQGDISQGNRYFGDTWQWWGEEWGLRSVGGPAARCGHTMSSDTARHKTVLFGGRDDAGSFSDTWEWDEYNRAWIQRDVAGPGARSGHAMTYDAARRVTVLFGGEDGSSLLSDTWEWDGNTWTLRASTGPSPRKDSAMVFDAARGVTILFGGFSQEGINGETWRWDGNTWTLLSASGPSPRSDHGMADDSSRRVVVLFGGFDGDWKRDTWEWNGQAWTRVATAGPPAREKHSLVFNPYHGAIVLFGGTASGIGKQDVWEWDGHVWQEKVYHPSPRMGQAMVYAGSTVMFGGYGFRESQVLGDAWASDGSGWWNLPGDGPPSRSEAAMTNSLGCAITLMLFGGADDWQQPMGDTWLGYGYFWSEYIVEGPSPRYGHGMIMDTRRDVSVLFGGTGDGTFGDTWEWQWDSESWRERYVDGPGPRTYHGMAYDSDRGVTVLFGGLDNEWAALGDTWEWDGTSWTQRAVEGPGPRFGHAMAYDSARHVTLLFGGEGDLGPCGDTWAWDGDTWSPIPTAAAPTARYLHSMVYVSAQGTALLFGGSDGGDETWVLSKADLVLTRQPGDQEVPLGEKAVFWVQVVGAPDFDYAWFRDGVELRDGVTEWGSVIGGCGTGVLTINDVKGRDAGEYKVIVGNECAEVTSESATLTVQRLGRPRDSGQQAAPKSVKRAGRF